MYTNELDVTSVQETTQQIRNNEKANSFEFFTRPLQIKRVGQDIVKKMAEVLDRLGVQL